MNTAITTTENRLLVQLTAKKYVPCNSLDEASLILRAVVAKGMSLRGWDGGNVYHPTKGLIAVVTPNGRIRLEGKHPELGMTTWRDERPFGIDIDLFDKRATITTDEL